MRSYPTDSSARDIITERRFIRARCADQLGCRRRALIGFAKAFAAEQDDLGVFDQAVGDGRRDGGVVEDIPPVGKCCVGGDERTSLVAVTSGNDLIEQIRGLLVERKISELIDEEKSWLGIKLELADQRVIDLRGQQVVEHVHGSCEQHATVGLTSAPGDDLR